MAAVSSSDPSLNTWLWQNTELADVSFIINFASTLDPVRSPTTEQDPQPTSSNLSLAQASSAAAQPSVHTKYLLHSQVISSSSAFLRASLTSSVGAAKRKQDGEEDACRWQLHADMDAGDAAAVEAVLRYMYTQQLIEGTPGVELLKIMQVVGDSFVTYTV